jgi:hypothetical protein
MDAFDAVVLGCCNIPGADNRAVTNSLHVICILLM